MQAANATLPTEFEFVIGNRPQELKAASSRRLRSYLSKQAWKNHRAKHNKSRSDTIQSLLPDAPFESQIGPHLSGKISPDSHGTFNRDKTAPKVSRRRRSKLQSVTYECVENIFLELPLALTSGPACTTTTTYELDRLPLPRGKLLELLTRSVARPLPMDTQFGGGRVDPFRSYPGPWHPYTPVLADHYIMQMARDIPELDQPGNKGLLRSLWFPLVLSDNAPFQVVMLLAAANFASINNIATLGCHILRMKHDAISAINKTLLDDKRRASDCLIGAVAKMASFEAMHGDVPSYKMHMDGLMRMLELRGGLDSLGLGGLLGRIVVWIDLNSSFLLNVPRYFPGATFDGNQDSEVVEILEPNPERFIAV